MNEKDHQIYQQGVQAGLKHKGASEETHKMFKRMEDKFDNFKKEFSSWQLELTEKLAKLPDEIINKADMKYASKETENIVKSAIKWIVITGLSVIGFLVTVVAILINAIK